MVAERIRGTPRQTVVGAVVVALWIVVGWAPPARGEESREPFRVGLRALERRALEDAAAQFHRALDESSANQETKGDINFYLGLTRQLQADAARQADQAQAFLVQAHEHFQKATTLRPTSSGSWNNLALICAKLGRDQEAKDAFVRAIELQSSEQNTHLVNYADFLAQRKSFESAVRVYRAATDQQPHNQRAQKGLTRCYLHGDSERRAKFVGFVWEVFDSGQIDWAQSAALDGLESELVEDRERDQLLSCIVRCLARQDYEPDALPNQPVAGRLTKLESKTGLADPLREIHQLHKVGGLDASQFSWWRFKVDLEVPASVPRGGWPQEAFAELARALGTRWERRGNVRRAEEYYFLAYRLTPGYLDPIAVVKLADLWVRQKDEGRLQEFLKSNELRIFEDKGDAIRSGNHGRIYEMHRALANVYVYLKQWKSDLPYHNAEFQIERALASAERFNQQAQQQNRPERLGDWRLADKLAVHYDEIDKPDQGFAVRVAQTENFRRNGMTSDAINLFRPIAGKQPPQQAKPPTIQAFNQLDAQFQQLRFAPPDDFGGIQGLRHRVPTERGDIEIVIDPRGTLPGRQLDRLPQAVAEALRAGADKSPRNANSKAAAGKTGGNVRLLPKETADEIQGIRFDGHQGQIELNVEGKPIQVPFRVTPAPGVAEPPPFRGLKP